MPPLSSIRPLSTPIQSSLRSNKARQVFHPSTKQADSVRFGNPAATEITMSKRLSLALQSAFQLKGLMEDALWGVGLSIIAAIIPPHAHALLMFPASFAVGMTKRAVSALINPKIAYDALHKVSKQAVSK